MRRLIDILLFVLLAATGFAQETRIVDSLQDVLATQQGREKVMTMLELTWDFYDISFDDCIAWGEKAIKEANELGYNDLEAKANYVVGIQFAHHADLDLAKDHLRQSYHLYEALADTANMFEALWSMARYELMLGSIDTANVLYDNALVLIEKLADSLLMIQVMSNKAIVHYQKGESSKALDNLRKVKRIADETGQEGMATIAESNMATILFETGRPIEARTMLKRLIPRLEADGNHYLLVTTYKTLGQIFDREIVNYDSAMYCFGKALEYSYQNVMLHADQASMRMYRCDVLSDIAHISFRRGEHQKAVEEFTEALRQAGNEGYIKGQMEAHTGLGTVLAYMGKAKESLGHIAAVDALEQASGIKYHKAALKLPLILDYARLGRYQDMERELRNVEEDRTALDMENADLHERNYELEETVAGLVARIERQDKANEALQADYKRCRMAFFGCLALALTALFAWMLVKILKHYFARRTNNPK